MSQCELTGKGPKVKNLVSHSNIKTKSIAMPNIQQKAVFSRILNRTVSLKMATSTIRTMEHRGGFDTFLLNQSDDVLSRRALTIKGKLLKKIRSKTQSAKTQSAKAQSAKAQSAKPAVNAEAKAPKAAKKAAPAKAKAKKGTKS